jgi:hypothetical protein
VIAAAVVVVVTIAVVVVVAAVEIATFNMHNTLAVRHTQFTAPTVRGKAGNYT